jgi:hypothetical protein|tara:strand:- start:634 stop:918 length:285 start_codon:yes stop_codon:yes gene_type:complete
LSHFPPGATIYNGLPKPTPPFLSATKYDVLILQQNKAIQKLESRRAALLVAEASDGQQDLEGNRTELEDVEKNMLETKRLRRFNELCLTAVMFQ